jgi:hypothetical protein
VVVAPPPAAEIPDIAEPGSAGSDEPAPLVEPPTFPGTGLESAPSATQADGASVPAPEVALGPEPGAEPSATSAAAPPAPEAFSATTIPPAPEPSEAQQPPLVPGFPSPSVRARGRRSELLLGLTALAGVCCLVVAVLAGRAAVAGQTRPPTRAERAAAAAAAVAVRWRSWPAGRIFPADLGYTTTLRGRETAHRVGISPDYRCAAALDAALARQARQDGCRAGIRASYVDELDGVVYTTGVLAFPDRARAAAFRHRLPSARPPVAALRALALPGTASARFTTGARQTATARQDGPYVLLTVAGYADGRPAAATGQYDAPAFSAAGQLAREILVPLNRPALVNCARRQWSC